jgi:hypothetical protein
MNYPRATILVVSCFVSTIAFAASVSKNLGILVTHGGDSLPPGVTLSAIDGETMTGTVMSHNYYARNGFTNAASSTFNSSYNNGGWDDPRFFPIGDDYLWSYATTSAIQSLNMNLSFRVLSGDMTALRTAGIYASPEEPASSFTNMGAESMGWALDEPPDWATISSFLAADGIDKVQHVNFTWNQFVFGPPSGTPGGTMGAAMSDQVAATGGNTHIHTSSVDIYWFAGSTLGSLCQGGSPPWAGGYIYSGATGPNCSGIITELSADQTARGDHYGDMVDQERAWLATVPGTSTAVQPVAGPYIENCDGFVNGGTSAHIITPPEFNWAVWSTILHGSRELLYFGATPQDSACGFPATGGFPPAIQTGQSVAMTTQATNSNGEVLNLAPIINSPFAIGYASVTPVGYVFPTQNLSLTNGIDIMAKWYTGGPYSNSTGSFGNGFYIFTTVRGSETQSNINATFTLAGSPTKSNIPVVGEGRTVNIASGQFTDTFANAYAVHIYGPISYP